MGSKNAAFFMGRSVKVVTRQAPAPAVHQLCIGADRLEERYRNSEVRASEPGPCPQDRAQGFAGLPGVHEGPRAGGECSAEP